MLINIKVINKIYILQRIYYAHSNLEYKLIRLRIDHVLRFAKNTTQTLFVYRKQTPNENFTAKEFYKAGLSINIKSEKSYNRVCILSKFEFTDAGYVNWCHKDDSRHIYVELNNYIELHNFYVPAGGDVPDISINPKFEHKISFIKEMKNYFLSQTKTNKILVGDLNIAPLNMMCGHINNYLTWYHIREQKQKPYQI